MSMVAFSIKEALKEIGDSLENSFPSKNQNTKYLLWKQKKMLKKKEEKNWKKKQKRQQILRQNKIYLKV